MPGQIDQILFDGKAFWPYGVGPQIIKLLGATHNRIKVFYNVVDSQHPQSKGSSLQRGGHSKVLGTSSIAEFGEIEVSFIEVVSKQKKIKTWN